MREFVVSEDFTAALQEELAIPETLVRAISALGRFDDAAAEFSAATLTVTLK